MSSPSESNDGAQLAPRFQVHSMFAPAERVLRAVESGEALRVEDVRDLARAVLAADRMTALARRLLQAPAARIRPAQAAELASMALEWVRAQKPSDGNVGGSGEGRGS
jgi:hypothetical protein